MSAPPEPDALVDQRLRRLSSRTQLHRVLLLASHRSICLLIFFCFVFSFNVSFSSSFWLALAGWCADFNVKSYSPPVNAVTLSDVQLPLNLTNYLAHPLALYLVGGLLGLWLFVSTLLCVCRTSRKADKLGSNSDGSDSGEADWLCGCCGCASIDCNTFVTVLQPHTEFLALKMRACRRERARARGVEEDGGSGGGGGDSGRSFLRDAVWWEVACDSWGRSGGGCVCVVWFVCFFLPFSDAGALEVCVEVCMEVCVWRCVEVCVCVVTFC